MTKVIDESLRVADVAHNAMNIIEDLDAKFELQTGLTKPDVSFLFFTVGLHCAKWLIMGQLASLDFDYKHDPNARGRLNNKEGDELAKEKQNNTEEKAKNKLSDDKSESGYRTIWFRAA
jgi:hypothetical protein